MQGHPVDAEIPLNKLCHLDTYMFPQFRCPGCGSLLSIGVQETGEEIRDDCRLFGS